MSFIVVLSVSFSVEFNTTLNSTNLDTLTPGTSNKSRPKYLETWGDADKPFAALQTENNATAKSSGLMVRETF